MTFGGLTFLAPLTLLGLLALPIIWWILRVTPPSPKKESFPPLRILQDVVTEEETPDSTPIWLLLFRILMGAIIAIALARPILQQTDGITTRPLTLVIDDGWDAAPNWSNVIREAEAKVADARRKNMDVLLITTAEPSTDANFVPAEDAMRTIKALRPKALPPQRDKAAQAIIGRTDISFAPGVKRAEAEFILPSELRSRVSQIRANGVSSAGAVKLLDDSWGRPLIGVVTPAKDSPTPLLSEPFYAKTALAPYADIFEGTMEDLLPLSPSVIIMPDVARTTTREVKNYVENGGLLIRFAGEKLAERPDSLLPVLLRGGGRALGGALTWEDPQRLASFNSESPFFGLTIPEDIVVRRQVMAEPGTETDTRTWARLEDGSPVVTSSTEGLGRIVLFHVTAGPEWSNLPVGGLYVEMLRRILPLARATPNRAQESSADWVAERVLNGFGRLETPPVEAASITDKDFADTKITAQTLPGLYRQGARRQALNTVKDPESLTALGSGAGISVASYGKTKDRTIGGWLLGAAMLMLALDAFFALSMIRT